MKIKILFMGIFCSFGCFCQPFGTDNLTTAINNGFNTTVVGVNFGMLQAIDRLEYAIERQLENGTTNLDLNGKIDNLDARIQLNMLRLQNTLENSSNQLLIASNSVPLSKKFPQLSAISTSNKDDQFVSLVIKGNFISLRRQKYNAYLEVAGKKIEAAEKTNNTVIFNLKKTELTHTNAISDNYLKLNIPYKGFLKKKLASYIINVKTYPSTIGKIEIYENKKNRTRETKLFESQEISQSSDRDDKKDILHCAVPDEGYKVDKTTVDKRIIWSQGTQGNDKDFWFGDTSGSNSSNGCVTLTTIYHRIGTSGKVRFTIKFSEYRDVDTISETLFSTNNVLDNYITSIKLPKNTSRIVFTQFDGRVFEFDSNFENDFFNFTKTGSYLYIRKK